MYTLNKLTIHHKDKQWQLLSKIIHVDKNDKKYKLMNTLVISRWTQVGGLTDAIVSLLLIVTEA